jgi:hypothetical protein
MGFYEHGMCVDRAFKMNYAFKKEQRPLKATPH